MLQPADDDDVAYQEMVDALLKHLCIPSYISGIFVGLEKANGCSLPFHLLEIIGNIDDRAVVPRGH